MKTGGVRFDFYDDPSGELVKKAWSTPDKLPALIKTAHILNTDERAALRDDAFALVMENEGRVLRKFACVDPGNTLLSMLYFKDSQEMLPEEAKGVAAVKLAAACEGFNLPVPEFIKEAAKNFSRTRDSMIRPAVGDEADWSSRTNLVSIQGSGTDSGRVVPTANQMKTAGTKKANMTPGIGMGAGVKSPSMAMAGATAMSKKMMGGGAGMSPSMPKMAAEKPRDGGEKLTNEKKNFGPEKKQPSLQQLKAERPELMAKRAGVYTDQLRKMASGAVRVTDQAPVMRFEKRASVHTALNGHYPLDSYGQVSKAINYFDEHRLEMDPVDRREYAVKTASRADELGLEYGMGLGRYGSMGYASDVDGHIHKRMEYGGENWAPVYQELLEKKASVPPETFAELLGSIDEESGLSSKYDGPIADPYWSTYGGRVSREKRASWTWSGSMGDSVTAEQLSSLSQDRDALQAAFTGEVVNAFQEDPVTIFQSLPDDSKTILARMANRD